MRKRLIVMPLLVAAAPAQPLEPGRWDVTSKVVEFVAPEVPAGSPASSKACATPPTASEFEITTMPIHQPVEPQRSAKWNMR